MTVRGWRYQGEERAPANRLEALADGVFAIVMTLLVLELGVPVVSESTSGEVWEALREMWPEFLIYVLSFMVLGVFWLIHKMIFDAIVASDPPLTWLNVLFLMVSSLLPFTTALVGEYRAITAVAVVYGLNLMLGFCAAWAIWGYATYRHRLTSEDIEPALVRGGNRMGAVYLIVLGGSTALAFASPVASYAALAVFVALVIGLTMVGRWERVMVLATARDLEEE
jgi:uncharacterized membrane protein